jgi:hypothetical protein
MSRGVLSEDCRPKRKHGQSVQEKEQRKLPNPSKSFFGLVLRAGNLKSIR